MNNHKDTFVNYSSEALLEKRALGNELSDDAHKAIEEIFAERDEKLPAKPSKPILLDSLETKGDKTLRHFGVIAFFFGAAVLAKVIINSWLVFLIAIICAVFYAFKWIRGSSRTPENQAEEEGLTEMMICAANGDLDRLKELVSFGVDVNAQSNLGTSALMYAVKNNHIAVVDFLLGVGANARLISAKGSTALSIAEKFQHDDLVIFLKRRDTQ